MEGLAVDAEGGRGRPTADAGTGLDRVARLEMGRRQFLALAGSVTAAAALSACSPSVVPPSPTAALTGPPPSASASPPADESGAYGQLRRLQAIVRAGPDHLPTLAAAAVATGDPAQIVSFVRDHIAVLPGSAANADPTTEVRWGARGTLASGRGTLRERADLLLELLGRAGVAGTVMTMDRPQAFAFGGPSSPAFTPDLGALGALWDSIDPSHPTLANAADDMPLAADRATSDILAALPQELRAATLIASGLPDRIPLVAFGEGTAARWATALGTDGLLDTAPGGLLGASDAVVPRISVSVDIAVNPPSGARIDRTILHEVLRHDWPADELAARHLTLAFAGPGSRTEMLGRDVADAPIRLPVLRLEAADPASETIQFVGGQAIGVAGGLIEQAEVAGLLTGPVGGTCSRTRPSRPGRTRSRRSRRVSTPPRSPRSNSP